MNAVKDIRRKLKPLAMTTQPIKTRVPFMTSYGFAPDVVIDVGVARGTPWLYRSFPDARLVLVDPQPDCERMVKDRFVGMDFDFHETALGPAPGTATLKIPKKRQGLGIAMASILDRTDALARQFPDHVELTVPVRPLDDIAAAYDGRIGLKIDTEGFEHQVLQGATETLKRCDFVILELSLISRFDGVAPPSAPMGLLAEAGLELRDMLAMESDTSTFAKPRHIDALFTRWPAS